jgi:putative heme-binding domain-containing protein
VIAAARQHPSAEVLPVAARALSRWSEREPARRPQLDRAVADLQGSSGILVRWHAAGPLSGDEAEKLIGNLAGAHDDAGPAAHAVFGTGPEMRVTLTSGKAADKNVWLAATDVRTAEASAVQFLGGAGGGLRVWVNGKLVYRRAKDRAFQPESDRFGAALAKGANRVLVEITTPKGAAEFHLRFRRQSSRAEHEKLIQSALARPGDVRRGRQVFFQVEKSQCLKCHRLGEKGESAGPDLTGVGGRFARAHIIESILEPSRTVTPGFQTVAVLLKDGRALSGVKTAEEHGGFTLVDNQGRRHALAHKDIDTEQASPVSTMPEGLERQLTEQEFIDLVAFLVSEKKAAGRGLP